jgi:UDP:flavonoid glycosyltransferase YjiC (YdhE family)
LVVPFFGDQLFWGNMIHKAGAGPEPIPHKKLNIENLRDALKVAVSPAAKNAAKRMAEQINREVCILKNASVTQKFDCCPLGRSEKRRR